MNTIVLFCFLLVATEEKAHDGKLKCLSNRVIESTDRIWLLYMICGEESKNWALF